MHPMKNYSIETASGRTIEVQEGGDVKGLAVFALHGTPGSRLLYKPHLDSAEARGIRLIGYNRPGYGHSTRVEGRNVAHAARDVAEIADSLGIDRFAVWGHSGGGDPALACAALMPGRVVASACVSGLAPYNAEGLDFYEGMGEFNVEDFKLMFSNREEWIRKNRSDAEMMAGGSRDDIREGLSSLLSEVDSKVLDDTMVDLFRDQAAEAFAVDIHGIVDDGLSVTMPWGFDPAAISVPVQIWHGGQDRFVPFGHGKWLAAHTPAAEAHLEEDEGHLSIFAGRMDAIHAWLVSKF